MDVSEAGTSILSGPEDCVSSWGCLGGGTLLVTRDRRSWEARGSCAGIESGRGASNSAYEDMGGIVGEEKPIL